MNETQVVNLTAQLRTSSTPSTQEPLGGGGWKVRANSSTPVAASTIAGIATTHSVVAETNLAIFTGTAAQVRAVAEALQASKVSVALDYAGDGTTDVWNARATSGLMYSIQDIINMATTHGVTATTNRAQFR